MADLAELVGSGLSNVIPGYTLSPLDLNDYGELERTFESRHVARAKASADGLPSDIALPLIREALTEVAEGEFSFGTVRFDRQAKQAQNMPLLAWLELRHRHPDVRLEEVPILLGKCDDLDAAWDAIRELAGYRRLKKKPEPQPESQSSGESSLPPSSKQEPPEPKSEG